MESNKKRPYLTCSIVNHDCLSKKKKKQTFLSMGYVLLLLRQLLRIVSPYLVPDCPTVLEHNASPDDSSRTTVTVSFRVVTGMRPQPDLSPNQLALRIVCGTETTLICKEDTSPMMRCPVLRLLTAL
ncbi:hypothetical protein TNCV_861311 [Trichonephila clavipes]|nr:hypothetical protein TNCV_861311 [Trichonephila clavipes]